MIKLLLEWYFTLFLVKITTYGKIQTIVLLLLFNFLSVGQKFQKVENDENRFFAITSSKLLKIDFVKGISSAIIFFTTIAFFMFFSFH